FRKSAEQAWHALLLHQAFDDTDRKVGLADTRRTHKEQSKRHRCRVFPHKLLRREFRAFMTLIGKTGTEIEVFEIAVGIPRRYLRCLEKTIGTRSLLAIATRDTFRTITLDARPARSATLRTNSERCHFRLTHAPDCTSVQVTK